MNGGTFSLQAGVLWGTIPQDARERILKAVFCVKCLTSVEMVRFTGAERKGDVVLKGFCAACGHSVVRVVETSEQDWSEN